MTVNNELELAGSELLVRRDGGHDEALTAERNLWRATVVWTLVLIPVCVAIWMLMVVLAVGGGDDIEWGAWLGIAAIVGVLAGAFFGGWAAFTVKAHQLDDVDAHAARNAHS